jgi:hypothetical protein
MKKIKDKLQARAKFNKGKRVGYAKRGVVDRETGELLLKLLNLNQLIRLLPHLLQHLVQPRY